MCMVILSHPPFRMAGLPTHLFRSVARCLVAAFLLPIAGKAMQVEGHTPLRHDRFASGYTTNPVVNPVPNTDPTFIGTPYDLSGILWNAGNRKQSFVFLSRKHYLYANHFGAGGNLQYFSNITGLSNATRLNQVALPESDIGIARLTQLLPASARIAIYPLLNLPSDSSYVGRELFMAGWFARFGKSKVSAVLPEGSVVNDTLNKFIFEYEPRQGRADFVQLEVEDSGSPSFIPFQNELTLTGNHFYVRSNGGGGDSFIAFPQVVAQLNAVLAEDGFALRFRTEPGKNWTGFTNSNWGTIGNWSGLGAPSATQVAGFAGNVTRRSISLGSTRTVRGLLFTGTPNQSGYTFVSGHTLQVGYVGIRNDAPATQTFNNVTALDAHQHWTASLGNLTFAGPIDLASHALNLSGPQTIFLNNNITGTGSLAVQQGTTSLSGMAAHSGNTYLYGGTLHVLGAGQLPPATPFTFGGGRLLIDTINLSTGPLRLLDDSILRFQAETASLTFAASSLQTWTAGKLLTIENFDSATHSLQIGTDFQSITPAQRAAIRFGNQPAFHAGNGSLRPATPFEQWQLQFFPQQAGNPDTEATLWGAGAQPAGDGVSNLVKYALNLPPQQPIADQLPDASITPEGYLQISVPRNPAATDITLSVEISSDLQEWKTGAEHLVIVEDSPTLLVVRDAQPTNSGEARYLRFRVALN